MLLAFGPIGAFALGSLVPLLALDWDPIRLQMVLALSIIYVTIKAAIATGDSLFAPDQERFRFIPTDTTAARFWWRRLTMFVGWFAFVWVAIQECDNLGFLFQGPGLVGHTLGLGAVAIALEAVWRRPVAPRGVDETPSGETHRFGRGAANIAVSIGIVVMWACWVGCHECAPSLLARSRAHCPAARHLGEPARDRTSPQAPGGRPRPAAHPASSK